MEQVKEIIYDVCQNYESIDTITNYDDLIEYISEWIKLKYPYIKHNKDFLLTIIKDFTSFRNHELGICQNLFHKILNFFIFSDYFVI